ncbi:MAG: PrsW family glutamic-type intramembrane protease [Candidatus Hodarchaeales archaeon]|jgi:hypothetical protein
MREKSINIESIFKFIIFIPLSIFLAALSSIVFAFYTDFNYSFFWELTKFFTPLTYLLFWPSIGFIILNWNRPSYDEIKLIKQFLPLVMFIGLIQIMGALLLNTRFFLLISIGFELNNPNPESNAVLFFQLLLYAIIGPIVEELMKIFPLIFLTLLVSKKPQIENLELTDQEKQKSQYYRLPGIAIRSERQILIYGLICGSLFTTLETIMYIYINSSDDITSIIQLVIRLGAPLHVFSTLIATMGIYNSIKHYYTNNTTNMINLIREFLPYFIGAWLIHAIWNSTAVLTSILILEGDNLPYLIFGFYGIILTISLIILLLYKSWKLRRRFNCRKCPLITSAHYHQSTIQITEKIKIEQQSLEKTSNISNFSNTLCRFCGFNSSGFSCSNCGASIFSVCAKCAALIAPTDKQCPNCIINLVPVISFTNPSFQKIQVIFIGITAIISFTLVSSVLAVFSVANQSESTALSNFTFFYLLFGLAGIFGVFWSFNDEQRGEGLLICYAFGTVLVLSFISIITSLGVVGLFSSAMEGILFGIAVFFSAIYLFRRYLIFLLNHKFISKSLYFDSIKKG